MTQRLKATGLAFAILVLGMGIIVAVTEYGTSADAAGPRLLTDIEVVAALDGVGLDIAPGRRPAHHPLLETAGTTITIGATSIEVYVYPDIVTRVTDEQVIQRHLLQLQALKAGDGLVLRVTSARNVLLLFYAESSGHLAAIHEAAHMLTSTAES